MGKLFLAGLRNLKAETLPTGQIFLSLCAVHACCAAILLEEPLVPASILAKRGGGLRQAESWPRTGISKAKCHREATDVYITGLVVFSLLGKAGMCEGFLRLAGGSRGTLILPI